MNAPGRGPPGSTPDERRRAYPARDRLRGQVGPRRARLHRHPVAKITADVHREKRRLTAPIYYEDARSSFKGDRGPELEATIRHVIELANEHGSALLWVWHSSRLARGSGRKGEARSILEVLTYLLRHRVTVRSVEDNEFTTNEMLWGFAAKQANKYAADLSVWVREGKERQWERGEWLGGPIPDGYLGVKGAARGRPAEDAC